MKIEVEVTEDWFAKQLVDVAESQVWHINHILQTNGHPGDVQDIMNVFNAANVLIHHYGGTPVEMRRAEAKIGFDIHGKPFK